MPVIIRRGTSEVRSQTIVLGTGLQLAQTAEGLAQLSAGSNDVYVAPSGADDTAAIQAAMYQGNRVRLAPGVFTVSGVIDVTEGVTLMGAGSGSGTQGGTSMTRIVKTNFPNPLFRFGDSTQFAGLEGLRIVGPGKAIAALNTAIMCARSGSGLPIARRLRFRDLHIEEIGEFGLYMLNCADVEIENVTMRNIGFSGVRVRGGSAIRLSTVRVESSGESIVVDNAAAGVVLDACEVEAGYGSFTINTATEVVLNGCVSRKCVNVPLKISGGSSVIVNGFRSDNTGAAYFVDQPHLLVDTAALRVQINGFTRVNTDQPGSLTREANVSAAGGPVLVGAHNFDRTKVTSGGKFAELSSVALP
jgi:polygalacturonase